MKRLQDKPNTIPVDATWPLGGMIDETGSNDGTHADQEFMNDYVQGLEKVFADSGLTANNNLDNATNGFQMYNALRKMFRPYRVYTALISQTGTANPTLTILGLNDVGTIAWTRTGVGQYQGTLTGVFVSNKTVYQITTGVNGGVEAFIRRNNDNVIQIDTQVGGVSSDALLDNTPIEIRVYDLTLT